VPPGYDDSDLRYPSIYAIQGLTGQLDMWRNRFPYRRNFPELVDEAVGSGDCPPCIVVFVDAWTKLGGSQFIDSPGTGRYHTYICDELVPWVDGRYRTLEGRGAPRHRGEVERRLRRHGQPDAASGRLRRDGDPRRRRALRDVLPARHAPLGPVLRDEYEGSFERFWEDFRSRPALSKDTDHTLLNDYCMAACYSADEDGTVQLPYDTATGELRPEIWERWLEWDPVRMVSKRADACRSLKAIYIDCGKRDQFFLDLGRGGFPAGAREESA
jgi:hypothetical protein